MVRNHRIEGTNSLWLPGTILCTLGLFFFQAKLIVLWDSYYYSHLIDKLKLRKVEKSAKHHIYAVELGFEPASVICPPSANRYKRLWKWNKLIVPWAVIGLDTIGQWDPKVETTNLRTLFCSPLYFSWYTALVCSICEVSKFMNEWPGVWFHASVMRLFSLAEALRAVWLTSEAIVCASCCSCFSRWKRRLFNITFVSNYL